MKIKSTLTSQSGRVLDVIYRDISNLSELGDRKVQGVHAFCFYGDKFVIVYAESKKYWTPPGDGVEPGESVGEAVIREIFEETNMKVLHQELIGFQDVFEGDRVATQVRAFCLVEPHGDFVRDPDDEITEIKLIDPDECRKYFDWGEIGEHLIKRALEIKRSLKI